MRKRTYVIPGQVKDIPGGIVAQHNLRRGLWQARRAGYTRDDLVRELDRCIELTPETYPTTEELR